MTKKDPATTNESEIVVICKIGDFSGLKQAESAEDQEQLELFVPTKGTVRVRKTTNSEGTTYTAGLKTLSKSGIVKSCKEKEDPVSAGYFEAFRDLASSLKLKRRHFFPGKETTIVYDGKEYNIPPIVYEVDVYLRADGRESEWCKIDIELGDVYKAIESLGLPETPTFTLKITDLPFKPMNAFFAGSATEEQKKAMVDLWETEWTQTPFGEALKKPEASVSAIPQTSNQPDAEITEAVNEGNEDEQAS